MGIDESPSVLVVACEPSDEFVGELGHLNVAFASGWAEAQALLRVRRYSLLIAAPRLAAGDVDALVRTVSHTQGPASLLIIRHRRSPHRLAWVKGGIGILRCPLVPGALMRSVEFVLKVSSP